MDTVLGGFKEYIILEREALKKLEETISNNLSIAQDDHNVEEIRKAKVWFEAIEWIKKNNIYTKDFQIKH